MAARLAITPPKTTPSLNENFTAAAYTDGAALNKTLFISIPCAGKIMTENE